MSDLLLVIGDKNLSSWSLRPWVLMRHAGIPFREQVLLFETPGWRDTILGLSPSARVPVLHDGGLRVWDSLAIAEHVAELHPDKELWPRDRSARAVARAVSAEMHSGFAAMRRELSMDVTARNVRRTLSREAEDDVRRVTSIFAELRARHANDGPFLFGRFSIADAMFAPVMFRFRTYGVPIDDAIATPRSPPARSSIRDYYETMLALPAMQQWERDAEAEVRASASAPRPSAPPDARSARAYYAVIFTSRRTARDAEAYEATAERMIALAKAQPGFLGIDTVRGADGVGVTVSYWESLEAIRAWKDVAEHRAAQAAGRDRFYERYEVRVCTVERGYKFPS